MREAPLFTQALSLAQWLLGRVDQEVVVAIRPEWLTSWDYRDRMSD